MKLTYNHTRRCCYTGYITQAIVVNLAPLLFIIFQKDYGLSYEKLAGLILLNFTVQMITDILAVRYSDRLGFRIPLVAAHVLCVLGLVLLGVLPALMSNTYVALVIAVVLYATGGGLLEVIVSPLTEAIPSPEEQKAAMMSLLHSFYSWGQAGVVLLSTVLLHFIGTQYWFALPILWAIVPLVNTLVLLKTPMPPNVAENERARLRDILKKPLFIAMLLMMMGAGASELTVSQWSSLFVEQGLGMSKMWGDIAGPCMFAILMGLGRVIYGVFGTKMNLKRFMLMCGLLCIVCYLTIALSTNTLLSLIACALSGFSVACMWPGSLSICAERFPTGGIAMFGALAVFGDIGCSIGPSVAGFVAGRVGTGTGVLHSIASAIGISGMMDLKTGILAGIIFPVTVVVVLFLSLRGDRVKAAKAAN